MLAPPGLAADWLLPSFMLIGGDSRAELSLSPLSVLILSAADDADVNANADALLTVVDAETGAVSDLLTLAAARVVVVDDVETVDVLAEVEALVEVDVRGREDGRDLDAVDTGLGRDVDNVATVALLLAKALRMPILRIHDMIRGSVILYFLDALLAVMQPRRISSNA